MLGFSKQIHYAIMALGYLARHDSSRYISAGEISEEYRMPPEMLAKILQKLARKGLVRAQAGPTGGYSLAIEPKDISLSDIIRAIEGPFHLTRCLGDEVYCVIADRCDIQEPLKVIEERMLLVFDNINLEEISHKSHPDQQVCQCHFATT